jgi:chemotaxis signal transduction protein
MTQASGQWLVFEIAAGRYALPVEAVRQVIGLGELRPAKVGGWAGLLPSRDGTLPMADGTVLVEAVDGQPAHGIGVVLRGRLPVGFTADRVAGLTSGFACGLVSRLGLPEVVGAALPSAEGTTLVLDAERLWHRLRSGLQQQPDGAGYRLRPLQANGPGENASRHPETDPSGAAGIEANGTAGDRKPDSAEQAGPAESPAVEPSRLLVLRVGSSLELGLPLERVLEVGAAAECRRLPNGPPHLSGGTSWRGRLVPLVILPERLGLAGDGVSQTVFVALNGRVAAALAVSTDEVLGSAVASTVPLARTELVVPVAWVHGLAQVAGRTVPILNPDALVVG